MNPAFIFFRSFAYNIINETKAKNGGLFSDGL